MREIKSTLRVLRWAALSLFMTVVCINGTIAQPYCAMACNNGLQVSLNGDCEAEITFDMMLEDPWNSNICLPNGAQAFQVLVMDPNGVTIPTSPVVTCNQIGAYAALGGVVPVKVKHWATGNECWGTIIVEDKLDPVLNCPPISVMCNATFNIPLPQVTDNCDNYPFPQNCGAITLTFEDEWIDYDCVPNNGLSARVIRTYTATDASGNTGSCDQVVDLTRATIADVDLPDHLDGLPGNLPAIDCTSSCAADLDNGENAFNCTGYPSKGGVDIDVAGGYCEINATWEDTRIDVCEGSFKILRYWRLVDWCTGEIAEYTQIIKVLDNSTDIACPSNLTVGTNDGPTSCSWSGNLAAGTVTNDGSNAECSSFTVETRVYILVPIPPYGLGTQEELFAVIDGNGGPISGLPIGTSRVNMEVTDDCGNHDTCEYFITVEDDDAPTPVCDEFTVATLSPYPSCEALIYAESFDDGSHDNCCAYEDLTFEVSKNANNGYGAFVTYDECIQNQMVFLKVTDCYGNESEPCMIEVSVDDKDDPIITCPADKTIECWTPFNDQGEATALDCSDFDFAKQLIQANLDPCGVGFVRYRFTATDEKGNSANCIQRINVVDSTPLSVSFPPDRTVVCTTVGGGGYQGSLDPADLPGNNTPNINGEDCELVAVNYTDLVLTISDSACFKVLRTWTVINWCIFDADDDYNVANGYYTDVQEIKVVDNAAPVVDCPADFTVGIFNEDCNATVNIPVPDADDCAPDDLLNYSVMGDFNSFSTPNVNIGTYNVVVRVEDGCNNKTDCPIVITVEDQKNPTAYCKEGIIITMMNTTPPMVPLWASDLDDGSFDNCPGVVSVSFSSSNTTDPGIIFDCDDLLTGAEQAVTVYITDAAGNQDFCETFVIVQDNQSVCSNNPGDPLIAGSTDTEANQSVEDVEVAINSGLMSGTVITTANGYTLDVMAGGDYTVTPSLDINPLNGVSTFDLVIMRKHILGTQLLSSPYKMIAADINNSGSITTLDMVNLRKLILQIETTFPNNTSWRFVETAYNFPQATNPWAEIFPEVVNVNNVNTPINNADFVAIKIGDLNGNASTSQNLLGADDRFNGTLTINAENARLNAGEQVTVEFAAGETAGYQFTLDFDQNALQLVDADAAKIENFGLTLLNEGAITASFNGDAAANFSLTFAAKADVTLSEALNISSRYTTAEAYTADGEVQNVELNFNGTIASADFELYQNTPNPFRGETVIGFNMPTEGAANLSVQDVSGKVLMVIDRTFAKGYNQVIIDGATLPSTGVLYYTLKTGEATATRKMIMVK
ncbi:MAG: hypothetical protein ACI9XO_002611 [Paraglaciecola sp.]|jgi:hypothetical protein